MPQRKPRRVEFESACVECMQPVFMLLATTPRDFGQVATTEGLRAFLKDGQCEFCGDILADFAWMETRAQWA